ncbi:RAMP superfamily CRISPR-associated protein [Thiolapillus sp.]
MSDYMRVIIEGELQCLSDLHLGSGELWKEKGEEGAYNNVVLDHNSLPYIPGASLRGYLLEQLADAPNARKILQGGEDAMGRLRVYDVRLDAADWQAIRRSRVAIHAVTRTAAKNQLFKDLLVPRGSRFQVRLELDEICEPELKALLQALYCIQSDNPQASLGGGKSLGRGRVSWESKSVQVLDDAAFIGWLKGEKPLERAGWKSFEYTPEAVSFVERWELTYRFHEPVLVNDPAIVEKKKSKDEDKPDMRYMRTRDGDLLIPGSSIKGVFRAWAGRILRTLSGDDKRAKKMLDELFGDPDGMGVLLWEDAVALKRYVTEHKQFIIAVDRFTGGVQEGAMLHLESAEADQAEGGLAFRDPLAPWQRALLRLLLRDASEGDLALGWGQARGFGGFTLKVASAPGWLTGTEDAEVEADFKALEEQCKGEAR